AKRCICRCCGYSSALADHANLNVRMRRAVALPAERTFFTVSASLAGRLRFEWTLARSRPARDVLPVKKVRSAGEATALTFRKFRLAMSAPALQFHLPFTMECTSNPNAARRMFRPVRGVPAPKKVWDRFQFSLRASA